MTTKDILSNLAKRFVWLEIGCRHCLRLPVSVPVCEDRKRTYLLSCGWWFSVPWDVAEVGCVRSLAKESWLGVARQIWVSEVEINGILGYPEKVKSSPTIPSRARLKEKLNRLSIILWRNKKSKSSQNLFLLGRKLQKWGLQFLLWFSIGFQQFRPRPFQVRILIRISWVI